MGIDDIFKIIQDYLRVPPLEICGSRSTISFGLPNLSRMKDEIGRALPSFDKPFTDI